MAKDKTKKATKKTLKSTSKKQSKSNSKQTTKQRKANVKAEQPTSTALVPVERSVPVLSQRVFGRNPHKKDELLLVDTTTRTCLAAMPIPEVPTEATKIAAEIGQALTRLYDLMDKAALAPGVRGTFEAHLACAYEYTGLAALF